MSKLISPLVSPSSSKTVIPQPNNTQSRTFIATQASSNDTTLFAVDVGNQFSEVGFASLVGSNVTPKTLNIDPQPCPELQDGKRFPTCLIIDDFQNPIEVKWGCSAKSKEPKEGEVKFDEFKHRISEHQAQPTKQGIYERNRYSKRILMGHSLNCIYNGLDQYINRNEAIHSPEHGRNFVFSYPDSYFKNNATARAEYIRMIQSVNNSGFSKNLDNIAVISDTRAAAFHCISKYRDELQLLPRTNILIVHAGWANVELAVYQLQSVYPKIEFSFVRGLTAGNCGSSAIDSAFVEHFLDKRDDLSKDTPGFPEILKSFIAAKESFGNGNTKEQEFHIQVAPNYPEGNRDWKLTRVRMETLFKEATRRIENDSSFDHMLRDVEYPISFAFSTGGLGSALEFERNLIEIIGEKSITATMVVRAIEAKSAVCFGSLQYGLQLIRSQRTSEHDYAVFIKSRSRLGRSSRRLKSVCDKGEFIADRNFLKESIPLSISKPEIENGKFNFVIISSEESAGMKPSLDENEPYEVDWSSAESASKDFDHNYRLDELLPWLNPPKSFWRRKILRRKEKCKVDADILNNNLALKLTHIKSQKWIWFATLKGQAWRRVSPSERAPIQ